MNRYDIHNDNCITVMNNMMPQSIDAIICDPPYGTTACSWDAVIPFEDMWTAIHRVIKPGGAILLFGQEPFSSMLRISNIKEYKYDIYWCKEKLTNIFQVKRRPGKVIETVSVFYDKQCTYNPIKTKHLGDIIKTNPKGPIGKLIAGERHVVPTPYNDDGYRYPTQLVKFRREDNMKLVHPTQKPVELMEYLVKTYTNQDDVVLDFTMGSGSTGVACIRQGRRFIGIESNTDYYEIASRRLNDEMNNEL